MIDYGRILNKTLSEIKPSGIRRFFSLLEEMEDVIALTVGQPDFVTPWKIRDEAIESLRDGKTYYTSNAGLSELRGEISAYLNRRFGLCYDPVSELLVTVGGSEAIDLAMRALISEGDEVILPSPSFVCYEPLARMAGAKVVKLPTYAENSFKLKADDLRRVITPKTKMIVLSYPNNPTGAIMTREDLEPIAELLEGTDITVLSDEIYAELTYGREHVSVASVGNMRERTLLVSGFSKAYAMTGWRLGYIAAPAPILSEIMKLHQYSIMCAPTASQFAAVVAMRDSDPEVELMRMEYNRRRRLIYDGLTELGLECFMPEGAFYIFPRISGFGLSSEEFCERLLYEERCAIVPGSAFGEEGEGYARISYAYSVKHIKEAIKKIGNFVERLRNEQNK